MTVTLPRCGLYRTAGPVAGVPAGRLVYFHDHGNPGPGIYLPTRWVQNRADWAQTGATLTDLSEARHLEPLPEEGFYRVATSFTCCAKRCVLFEAEQLVQLGYDGTGTAIVFVPELSPVGLRLPERGTVVDASTLRCLSPLKVPTGQAPAPQPAGGLLH